MRSRRTTQNGKVSVEERELVVSGSMQSSRGRGTDFTLNWDAEPAVLFVEFRYGN